MSYTLPEPYDSVFWEGKIVDVFRPEQMQAAFDAGRASRDSAVRTLEQLGYTDNGGELWKPPIGKAPDSNLIDSLRAEIEALRADAERYRWLMSGFPVERYLPLQKARTQIELSKDGTGDTLFQMYAWASQDQINAAIDAAMVSKESL